MRFFALYCRYRERFNHNLVEACLLKFRRDTAAAALIRQMEFRARADHYRVATCASCHTSGRPNRALTHYRERIIRTNRQRRADERARAGMRTTCDAAGDGLEIPTNCARARVCVGTARQFLQYFPTHKIINNR